MANALLDELTARGAAPFYALRLDDDPAAGAEAELVVPGDATFDLVALRVELVTDATVANRRVAIVIDDGTTEALRIVSPEDQAASLTRTYQAATELGYEYSTNRAGVLLAGLPALPLAPGWRIRTATTGLQAGDNFAAPRALVVERSTGPGSGDLDELVRRLSAELG